MKNIQIIDGAANATFSLFQTTDADFEILFPDGQDMELAEDLHDRVDEKTLRPILDALWKRPIVKSEAQGIHGTLFYDWSENREYLPKSKREVDWAEGSINEAQRKLFRSKR